MRIGTGAHTYEWIEDWAQLPDTAARRGGWAHPGVAVTNAGHVITFHPGEPAVLELDSNGRLLRTIPTGLTEGHGITVSREDGTDFLWIADPGSKRVRVDGQLESRSGAGQVVKMTMDGEVVLTLETPDLAVYQTGKYAPTAVAINEERHGGNGDVWVADGYGQSHVHHYRRFSKHGEYLGSINGAEGAAGPFACPHGISVDTRHGEPELYIADRTNHRIQVYDTEGQFKRVVGTDFLSSPSVFARDGDYLIVGELRARLALLDGDDKLVGYLGANEAVCSEPGWPNMLDAEDVATRTNRLQPGKFNSPHGLAADSNGNLYVAEWLIGGRMVKLVKA